MTCAKRIVHCVIEDASGRMAVGSNMCNRPQKTCPRAPDDDTYTLCAAICEQAGHAEVMAIRRAHELGMRLRGAHARIYGHHRVCPACQKILREEGVTWEVCGDR